MRFINCSSLIESEYYRYLLTKKDCIEFNTIEQMEEDFAAAKPFFDNKLLMGDEYIFVKDHGYVIPYRSIRKTYMIKHLLNGIQAGDSITVETSRYGKVDLYTIKTPEEKIIADEIYTIIERNKTVL